MSKIQLYLVDICDKILGNAIYNCRQSSFWDKLEIIVIRDSDFFNKVDKNLEFDAILFNPPQTPFQNPSNRLDKNGGTDGIKFY
jgi:methylase of polypeptide subunit release factors